MFINLKCVKSPFNNVNIAFEHSQPVHPDLSQWKSLWRQPKESLIWHWPMR